MEKKTKLLNFIKGVLIVLAAAGILAGLSRLLVLKSEDGINQFDAFYKQPKNSVDVIFSGSSKVYCDIATGVLWDNYGIAAFDLGGAEAPSWVSYYQLKEALRTQRPKVIFYEVSVAAMFDVMHQRHSWASDNAYGMKWDSNRINQLRVNSDGDDFYLRLNPFNVMHGRYNDLSENDFLNVRNTANYKGFDPREATVEQDRPDIDNVTDMTACSEKEEEYTRKIIAFAKEEGVPIVLFASPYHVGEGGEKILNYMGMIAESEGADFIDFNRRYDEIGLDFATDMADTDHLNYKGNYKFSNYLGSILRDEYGLPDRRGDEKYVSWEWDAALQRNERRDQAIRECESVTDVMALTDQNYLVFAINEGNAIIYENNRIADLQEINEDNEDSFFRMTARSGKDTFLFTANRVSGDRRCSLFVNDREYREDFGNIAFVYDALRHEYIRSIAF